MEGARAAGAEHAAPEEGAGAPPAREQSMVATRTARPGVGQLHHRTGNNTIKVVNHYVNTKIQ